MSPQTVRYLIYAWVLWLAASRAVRVRHAWHGDFPESAAAQSPRPLLARIAIVGSAVGYLLAAAGLWAGASLFFAGDDLTALRVVAIAAMAVALCDAFLALRTQRPGARPWVRVLSAASALLLGIGVLGCVSYLRGAPDSPPQALRVAYPVRGSWTVLAGGRTALTNPHHGHPAAQDYAVDLARQSGETEGEAVYAPVAGTVVLAVDGRGQGSPEAEGNVIVIRTNGGTGSEHSAGAAPTGATAAAPTGATSNAPVDATSEAPAGAAGKAPAGATAGGASETPTGATAPGGSSLPGASGGGTTVWLAHLQRGSLQVHVGDRVAAGQPVARCGATGSAARAHLHIHAEEAGRPVPLLFGPECRFLVRNDTFTN